MKKQTLFLGLAALSSAALSSCGTKNDSKVVTDLADFIDAASVADLKIASSNVVEHKTQTDTGDNKNPGVTRKAAYYQDGNFSISTSSDNHIGYTLKGDAFEQYLLIDSKKNTGTIYNNASALDAERAIVSSLLKSEYETLLGRYNDMKSYMGKSASEIGFDSYSLRRSIASTVAGYVFQGYKSEENSKTETYRYITMDKINGVWAITNYTERITKVIADPGKSTSTTNYDISEATLSIVDKYPVASIGLSTYTLTVDGMTAGDIVFTDGIPLTKK